jgi:hypothetical protein
MNVQSDTSWHEMRRRWVLGELESNDFGIAPEERAGTRRLLDSGVLAMEHEGVLRHRRRIDYWNSFPSDTQWRIAQFESTESEFLRLKTIQESGWATLTNGSFRLVDAAANVENGSRVDRRVFGAISACRRGELNLMGITLHSTRGSDIYTVIEGTARLVALYLCWVKNSQTPRSEAGIEVVWGISETPWKWPPGCD